MLYGPFWRRHPRGLPPASTVASMSMPWLVLVLLFSLTAARSRAAATNLFENFEGTLAGWTVRDANAVGTAAYWGIVSAGFGSSPNGGSRKAYCAGTGFQGTTNAPRYRNDMTAQFDRVVNLAGQSRATLRFRHRIAGIESDYDRARVLVDGVEVWSLSVPVPQWTNVALNLDAFTGGSRLLRFEFRSDSSQYFEGWYVDDIVVTDEWLAPPPPPNDDFERATRLAGCCGVTTGTFTNSTSQAGEPGSPDPSVWFVWTATTNGRMTIRSVESSFDAHLCVFTGTNLAGLAPLACEPPEATNSPAGVQFDAVRGLTYFIQLTSRQPGASLYVLDWNQPAGLGRPLLPDLSIGVSEARNWLHGWSLDTATMPGHVLLRLSTATPNLGAGPLELRGNSSVPGVVQRIYRKDGGFSERYAGTFTFHPGHNHLHFDNWVNFHLRSVLPGGDVGDIVVSGRKTSFAVIDLLAYDLSLSNSAPSGVYDDGLIQGISVGWADVYDSSLPDQWIDVTGLPAGSYWLEAVVDPENRIEESDEVNNTSRIPIEFPGASAPPNDAFTNAVVLAGITAGRRAANYNATRESGEPAHAGNTAGASIWYRWTAPSNMAVRISTQGSSIDTVLAVYRGSAVNALIQVVADDDAGGDGTSLVTFNATAGVTYSWAVDGYRTRGGTPETGSLQLHFNPGWNDLFNRPVRLTGPAGTVDASSRLATREPGEPLHGGQGSSNSIWYVWTAPRDGRVTMDTLGSSFDTVLAVYRGTNVSVLTPVAADDNAAGSGFSRVVFEATGGAEYRIAVAGNRNATGLVTVNWTFADLPPVFVTSPIGTNVVAGGTHTLAGVVSGSEPLFYRWELNDVVVETSERILGATSPALTLTKIGAGDAGAYRLIVTNAFGAVTSSPAYVVVMQNPRIVFFEEAVGPIGGLAALPVMLEPLGTERFVDMELQWDPAQLEYRGVTNRFPNVVTNGIMDTARVAQGRLHLRFNLAPPADWPGRPLELAMLVLAVPDGVADGSVAPVGFGLPRSVRDAEGLGLTTVFLPGIVELAVVPTRVDLSPLLGGTNTLVILGIAGRDYVLETSVDLVDWTPSSSGRADLTGRVALSLPGFGVEQRRFYRARLLP